MDDGHLRLELVGRLEPEEADDFVVLGETLDGPFTLLKCMTNRSRLGRIETQDISAAQFIKGLHLLDPHEPVFTSTTVEIEYLLGWLGNRSNFGLTIEDRDNRWTGVQSATTTPLDDRVCCTGR